MKQLLTFLCALLFALAGKAAPAGDELKQLLAEARAIVNTADNAADREVSRALSEARRAVNASDREIDRAIAEARAAIDAAESDDEKLALIESQLSDACQIICDIYSRFLFESSVFEARPQELLDADRLCQLMLEAQKKAYGDGLDQSCLHPYMWLCKGHYYSGSLSFYNFPYAFGGLFARGLYAKYQQEGKDFVPLYKKMLHATSVTCVEDTARIAGIDLTDKAFWRQGLQSLADEIDLFCQLVK